MECETDMRTPEDVSDCETIYTNTQLDTNIPSKIQTNICGQEEQFNKRVSEKHDTTNSASKLCLYQNKIAFTE